MAAAAVVLGCVWVWVALVLCTSLRGAPSGYSAPKERPSCWESAVTSSSDASAGARKYSEPPARWQVRAASRSGVFIDSLPAAVLNHTWISSEGESATSLATDRPCSRSRMSAANRCRPPCTASAHFRQCCLRKAAGESGYTSWASSSHLGPSNVPTSGQARLCSRLRRFVRTGDATSGLTSAMIGLARGAG